MPFEEFAAKMRQSIEHSYYKYGNAYKTYPELAQAYKCALERAELYLDSKNPDQRHNTELMVDVANFCMLECMFPAFESTRRDHYLANRPAGTSGWKRDFSEEFVKVLSIHDDDPESFRNQLPNRCFVDKLIEVLEDYISFSKTDFESGRLLGEVALLAYFEFAYPSFDDSFYRSTSDSASPGLAGGISYKEMMEQVEAENGGRYGW